MRSHASKWRVGLVAEGGNARHRDADVVLDVEPFLRLRQRNAFADMPQAARLRQALGDHGVAHQSLLQRVKIIRRKTNLPPLQSLLVKSPVF